MTEYRPFKKKKSYTLTAVIVLLALFISFSSFRDLFGIRPIINSAVYPFQFITVSIWKGVTGFPAGVMNLGNLARENTELKDKLAAASARNTLFEDLASENERLRAALNFKAGGRWGARLLLASIIGKNDASWFSVLQIDKGSNAGVKVGLPVIAEEGLVGRVAEVSSFTAKVLLITDPGSDVAASDQRSRDNGAIEGNASNRLTMKYVSRDGDVQVGDKVVTSPLSEVFPPGIAIGTVSAASKKEYELFYQIEVKPAVSFSKLEAVFLVL